MLTKNESSVAQLCNDIKDHFDDASRQQLDRRELRTWITLFQSTVDQLIYQLLEYL
jgi:hypothetical protein